MNIAQIEENVKALVAGLASGACTQKDFIYELLLAYGHRKQSVSRLRSGERNLASKGSEFNHSEIIWKRHLYFKQVEGGELLAEIDQMRKEKLVATNKIRFVIVTDFDQLFAHDLKTNDRLDISLDELPNKFDFFLPWAGMEKAVYRGENPADVKAAEKMAKLFDLIKGDNFDESNKDDTEALHGLNVFLTRLLFCFFAEDTEIFADNQFSNAIQSHTKDDGSDLSDYLNRLFTVLNTSGSDRGELPEYLSNFPYVNGGLFATDIPSPSFTAKSRRMLIECGSELDWSDINPDIFGSMIQAVVHSDQRGGMGMHYTSVTNIMKVIEPLFLNDLYEELEKIKEGSSKQKDTKLKKFQQRISSIKVFDPACGSGNFLIIAYKELRKLEMEVLKRLQDINDERSDVKSGVMGQVFQAFSVIKLSQFYGIELDDFAHEVAILSLWLAEHQMNVEFKVEFGESQPSLPLKNGGNVVCGNAIKLSWFEVCKNDNGEEVFILGNPPYLGQKQQSKEQKSDLEYASSGVNGYKKLDYIACWFLKASKYITKNNSFSFVTTSSLCQGIQVPLLWPNIFNIGLEISFAYKSFEWSNNAANTAGVTCSIVGIRHISNRSKYLFDLETIKQVKNINAYLVDGNNVIVEKSRKPISDLPIMSYGNMALDGGHLLMSDQEKNALLNLSPEAGEFIKKTTGSNEFIKGIPRWCLWIEDSELCRAKKITAIAERIESCREFRATGGDVARTLVGRSHQFRYRHTAKKSQILVPLVSSERRKYIPVGYVDKNTVIQQTAQVIYDAELYVFSIVNSYMHMIWVRAVCGRLTSRLQYSNELCYNTFPLPSMLSDQKEYLSMLALKLLSVREEYPEKTFSELYDPKKMPTKLSEIHSEIDMYVENIFRDDMFENDDDRLSYMLNASEAIRESKNA